MLSRQQSQILALLIVVLSSYLLFFSDITTSGEVLHKISVLTTGSDDEHLGGYSGSEQYTHGLEPVDNDVEDGDENQEVDANLVDTLEPGVGSKHNSSSPVESSSTLPNGLGIGSGISKVASEAVDAIKHWVGLKADEEEDEDEDEDDYFYGLAELCENTVWRPGVWLHCHSGCGPDRTSVCGGLNNARNRISTCVRYAIDAGLSIILPTVTERAEAEISALNGDSVCADNFFNTTYLEKTIQKYCPKMGFTHCDDHSHIKVFMDAPGRPYQDWAHSKPNTNTQGTFGELINRTLESRPDHTTFSPKNPASFGYEDPYNGWNYTASNEGSTIRKALFKALQYNEDLLEIGSRILESEVLQRGLFYGLHLRGETDWPPSWGSREQQIRLYLEDINRSRASGYDITAVYVSCGDRGVIDQFRADADAHGLTVVDKWSLLADRPEILEQMQALHFDRRAIVEYRVLLAADFYIGPTASTMSDLVAFARTVDDEEDFFETYINPGSWATDHITRVWDMPDGPEIRGDGFTKMLVVSGPDVMDNYPKA